MTTSGTGWTCRATAPGLAANPDELAALAGQAPEPEAGWLPATVPGTAAGALRAAGRWCWGHEDEEQLDGQDWWWRWCFAHPGDDGPWDLELGGLATLADVWLNGAHVLCSQNMFVAHRVPVDLLLADNELTIRCAAMTPVLTRRHPRPRFKSRLVRHQSLRWYRTTLLGRMPGWSRWAAPVGPWRPVKLSQRSRYGALTDVALRAGCTADGGGTVTLSATLSGGSAVPERASLIVGDVRVPVAIAPDTTTVRLTAVARFAAVRRWWPHGYGDQPRYEVAVELDGERVPLRSVGFRTVSLDTGTGEGFALRINGERLFCRGVTWGPADAATLSASDSQVVQTLELVRDGGINMIRIGGFGVYEDVRFWDACDRLGIMVWQDCMIASVDPPDDAGFAEQLAIELRQQFGALQGRPSLMIACGSSETYQQGAMYGLGRDRYRSALLEETIPMLLEPVSDVPYIPSSPSGGEPPIRPDAGVAHYFGVGAYLRDAADARLAGVRFAAECLSFSNPPERATVEREYGGAAAAGHDPRWKSAVAHDAGTSWDFEDVRDHYVRALFGVDPLQVRYGDPEHALDLGRAAIVELIERVLGDWRHDGSGCAGAIVLAWGDLWPGAGWGMVDASGMPKASYHALARASAPRAVRIRDQGLSGLAVDVFNDPPRALNGTLGLRIYNSAAGLVESVEHELAVDGRSQLTLETTALLGGFRDLNGAYRFAPMEYDVVCAEVADADGTVVGRAYHLPSGCARPREADVGLAAVVVGDDAGSGRWPVQISANRFAQYVSIDAPGFVASHAWFHLAPGEQATITLTGEASAGNPRGTVRALNAIATARIEAAYPWRVDAAVELG